MNELISMIDSMKMEFDKKIVELAHSISSAMNAEYDKGVQEVSKISAGETSKAYALGYKDGYKKGYEAGKTDLSEIEDDRLTDNIATIVDGGYSLEQIIRVAERMMQDE